MLSLIESHGDLLLVVTVRPYRVSVVQSLVKHVEDTASHLDIPFGKFNVRAKFLDLGTSLVGAICQAFSKLAKVELLNIRQFSIASVKARSIGTDSCLHNAMVLALLAHPNATVR